SLNNTNASSGNHALIANNFIQVGGGGTAYGIAFSNSGYFDIYHNSVHISSTAAASCGLYSTGGSGNSNTLKNNIFFNDGGGYASNIVAAAAIGMTDYNDVYSTGRYVASWGGINCTSLS